MLSKRKNKKGAAKMIQGSEGRKVKKSKIDHDWRWEIKERGRIDLRIKNRIILKNRNLGEKNISEEKVEGGGWQYEVFSFNLLMLLIKNKFYMSSHSHKRVEPNSQKSSKFSSKYSSQPQNVLGTVIKDDKNY